MDSAGIKSTTGRVSRIALGLPALVAVLTVGAAVPASAEGADVGHRVENLTVPNSVPCPVPNQPCDRKVKVHLWYPADHKGLSDRPKTVYTSGLHGQPLPEPWVPLSWKVEADIARESDAIDPHGQPFPVIVFSHGSTNDPIDYAHTLELIAAEGFVVAAPYHANNTQDDVRIDFINGRAGRRCSRATTGSLRPARGQAFQTACRTASGTSATSWRPCPAGSETASTSRARAFWGTPAGQSPPSPPQAVVPSGGLGHCGTPEGNRW